VPAPASTSPLAKEVAEIEWYHSIRLPGGIVTPGVNKSARALRRLRLPESLAGLSVLDVGAWDGFYSFEAKRRGAARVVATDSYVWEGKTWAGRAGFDLARSALGLDAEVEDRQLDVMELDPLTLGGAFDVVLFLGVLYHLRDPFGAIERVAGVTGGMLVVETECALEWVPYPAARVFSGSELNQDASNWFAFNTPALVAMLRSLGFEQVSVMYRTPGWKVAGKFLLSLCVPRFRLSRHSRRVVVHAHR
jgi:tRNA (mo5U34)-methyltransferase